MAEIKRGSVSITLADHLAPPHQAGRLTVDEVKALPRARRGVGLACDSAAATIDKLGNGFMLPAGVSAQGLREAGRRAEEIDLALVDLDVIATMLKQANAIFDSEAHKLLCQVNDQLKAQGKQNPELFTAFQTLVDYFSNRKPATAEKGGATPAPVG